MQYQIMLQNESGHPHIVRWNRRALFPKLAEHGGVMVSRLIIGEDDTHTVLQEKPSKGTLFLGLTLPQCEAGPKFAQYHKRKYDCFGFFQESLGFYNPIAKIDVSVRIERDSHRQRSSSTRSCAASASRTAFSDFHVPAISLRSRRFSGVPATPIPAARASRAVSFKLLPAKRACSRNASSTAGGTSRMVYCIHLL